MGKTPIMFWMLLALLFLAIFFIYLYAKKYVILQDDVDKLIDDVISSGSPKVAFSEMKTVKLSDTTICYEDTPSPNENAEVVFLLHGLSQTMLNFPPYFCQKLIDDGLRMVRIDHQGGGGSSWVKDWGKLDKYDLEDMARHAVQVADHLGIEKFHVIGMSMGGMIGQRMALEYKDRITSLISIMGTASMFDKKLPGVPLPFYCQAALVIVIYGRNLKTTRDKIKFKLATYNKLQGDNSYTYDDRVTIASAYYEVTQKKGFNGRSTKQQAYAIKKSGSRLEELKSLNVPTLVIHGTHDPLVKLVHADKCIEAIPNCKKLYLEGMGHHLPQAYNDEICSAIIKHIHDSVKEVVI